jgi:hypothetical protein
MNDYVEGQPNSKYSKKEDNHNMTNKLIGTLVAAGTALYGVISKIEKVEITESYSKNRDNKNKKRNRPQVQTEVQSQQ